MRSSSILIALLTTLPLAVAQDVAPVALAPSTLRLRFDEGSIEVAADRPDRHAPIGVRGAHPERVGSWTFSYRYLRQDHEGLVDGDGEISEQDVFDEGFSQTPTRQVHERHLFSALYGYDESLSFRIDIPWESNDMDVVTDAGDEFSTRTIGLGDVVLTGIYSLTRREDEFFHFDLGVGIPTGSRDEKDETPTSGGKTVKLPYSMQLGSGTIDLHPGLTYFRLREDTSWGAQAFYSYRVDENSDGYTLGDATHLTAWVARRFQEDLSGSVRLAYRHLEPIDGRDEDLDPTLDPAADPDAQGGDRLDFLLGVNYTRPGGHRFAGEIGGPIFQDLDGPQLEADILYSIGWQFSF